jgi:hypothetical protein
MRYAWSVRNILISPVDPQIACYRPVLCLILTHTLAANCTSHRSTDHDQYHDQSHHQECSHFHTKDNPRRPVVVHERMLALVVAWVI